MATTHAIFLVVAIVGIVLNIVVSMAITCDKEMRNPTFQFMVQLAIADVESLLGVVVGPVCQAITNARSSMWSTIFAYLNAAGCHAGDVWLVLVAFSRWTQFVKPEKVQVWFNNRRLAGIVILVWLFEHAYYAQFFFHDHLMHTVGDTGWYGFYRNTSLSDFMANFDIAHNYIAAIFQVVCTALTFRWILKIRKQTSSMSPDTRRSHKQEVNLFIQCAIDCSVYVILIVVGEICADANTDPAVVSNIMTVVALINFIDCSVLYFIFNKRLRASIVQWIKKNIFRVPNNAVTPVAPVIAAVPRNV